VRVTSPGSGVMTLPMNETIGCGAKISRLVRESCALTPLTRH
jgi:hypothetical protein